NPHRVVTPGVEFAPHLAHSVPADVLLPGLKPKSNRMPAHFPCHLQRLVCSPAALPTSTGATPTLAQAGLPQGKSLVNANREGDQPWSRKPSKFAPPTEVSTRSCIEPTTGGASPE